MNMNKILLTVFTLILIFFSWINVNADTKPKKILAICSCEYDANRNAVCQEEECSVSVMEAKLKMDCGRKGEVNDIKYVCNGLPVTEASSPLEACRNYISKFPTGDLLTVTANASCTIGESEAVGEFFCEEQDVMRVLIFGGYILMMAKIMVPFILIAMGTFDYFKAVTDDKNESMQKQTSKFIKRIIIGIMIFFIPSILNAGMSLVSGWSDTKPEYEQCAKCILEPNSCK